jgi:hypothetical protein
MPCNCKNKKWDIYGSLGVIRDTFSSYKATELNGAPSPKTSDADILAGMDAKAKSRAKAWGDEPLNCDDGCKEARIDTEWMATFKEHVRYAYKEGKHTYYAYGTVEYEKANVTKFCVPITDGVKNWSVAFGDLKVTLPASALVTLAPELVGELMSRINSIDEELSADNPLYLASSRIRELDISDYFNTPEDKKQEVKGGCDKGKLKGEQ